MGGEEAERGLLPLRPFGEGPAEQALRAGLVRRRAPGEAEGLAEPHGPAGEELGEFRHIGLGVAAGGGEGVQLQHLPRQVLVQAAAGALAEALPVPIETWLSR
jgi:hypothetical protein